MHVGTDFLKLPPVTGQYWSLFQCSVLGTGGTCVGKVQFTHVQWPRGPVLKAGHDSKEGRELDPGRRTLIISVYGTGIEEQPALVGRLRSKKGAGRNRGRRGLSATRDTVNRFKHVRKGGCRAGVACRPPAGEGFGTPTVDRPKPPRDTFPPEAAREADASCWAQALGCHLLGHLLGLVLWWQRSTVVVKHVVWTAQATFRYAF